MLHHWRCLVASGRPLTHPADLVTVFVHTEATEGAPPDRDGAHTKALSQAGEIFAFRGEQNEVWLVDQFLLRPTPAPREDWHRAFLAALTGFCLDPSIADPVKEASEIADAALEALRHRGFRRD